MKWLVQMSFSLPHLSRGETFVDPLSTLPTLFPGCSPATAPCLLIKKGGLLGGGKAAFTKCPHISPPHPTPEKPQGRGVGFQNQFLWIKGAFSGFLQTRAHIDSPKAAFKKPDAWPHFTPTKRISRPEVQALIFCVFKAARVKDWEPLI